MELYSGDLPCEVGRDYQIQFQFLIPDTGNARLFCPPGCHSVFPAAFSKHHTSTGLGKIARKGKLRRFVKAVEHEGCGEAAKKPLSHNSKAVENYQCLNYYGLTAIGHCFLCPHWEITIFTRKRLDASSDTCSYKWGVVFLVWQSKIHCYKNVYPGNKNIKPMIYTITPKSGCSSYWHGRWFMPLCIHQLSPWP